MADPTTAYATEPGYLTSIDEMVARFGQFAIEVANDETTPNKFALAMAEGTDEVVQFLQKRASFEALAANRWARSKATILACWHFSGFGGEMQNSGLSEERERVLDLLEKVFEGKMDIPNIEYSGEENADACPVVTNMAVDLMRLPATRTVTSASTGMRRGVPAFKDYPTSYPRRPNG